MESSEWRPDHLVLKANEIDEEHIAEYIRHIRQCLYALEMSHTLQEFAVEFECIATNTIGYRNGLQVEMQNRVAGVAMNN